MNFFEFYGLKEDPFRLSPDPEFFYPTGAHRLALDSLDYAVEQKEGFCLITGDPGTGKTTVLKVFVDKWKTRSELALILTPRLAPEEFLSAVLDELRVSHEKAGKVQLLKAFRDFLLEKSMAATPVIIIVDEAQNLSDETLEELRLLSNLETEKEKLLQIILVGQSEIEKRLKGAALRQLDQRITVRVRLCPLTPEELFGYINHRLLRAGKGYLKVEDSLSGPVYRYSKGVPRLINIITSRTIMSAYLDGQNVVTPRHVRYALRHIEGGRRPLSAEVAGKVFGSAAAVAVFFLVFLAAYSFAHKKAAQGAAITASAVSSDKATVKNERAKKSGSEAHKGHPPGIESNKAEAAGHATGVAAPGSGIRTKDGSLMRGAQRKSEEIKEKALQERLNLVQIR